MDPLSPRGRRWTRIGANRDTVPGSRTVQTRQYLEVMILSLIMGRASLTAKEPWMWSTLGRIIRGCGPHPSAQPHLRFVMFACQIANMGGGETLKVFAGCFLALFVCTNLSRAMLEPTGRSCQGTLTQYYLPQDATVTKCDKSRSSIPPGLDRWSHLGMIPGETRLRRVRVRRFRRGESACPDQITRRSRE